MRCVMKEMVKWLHGHNKALISWAQEPRSLSSACVDRLSTGAAISLFSMLSLNTSYWLHM